MTRRPPPIATRLLAWLTPAEDWPVLREDLAERFAELARREGRSAAKRWYRRQVVRSIRPTLARWLDATTRSRTAAGPIRSSVDAGLVGDMRVALRGLRRSPGYAVAAAGILTLGIGGTTAVFSVLNAILIQPLPYEAPDQLAILWTVNTQQNLPDGTSEPNLKDWRDRTRAFAELTAYYRPQFTDATVTGIDRPERIHVAPVVWNFFSVLGVGPLAGRSFTRDDLEADLQLVVIGDAYAQQRFGGRAASLGQALVIDGQRYEVIGVMPASLELPYASTVAWTLHDDRIADLPPQARNWDALVVLGRLRDGVGIDDAQRDMTAIAAQLAEEYPASNANLGVDVRSLLAEITGERLPQVLWMVFGAAVLVLMIAATNVAHLTLARGAQRRRELAIRCALGAGRGRLVRQLVVESTALGLVAGAGGIAIGAVMIRGLVALAPADAPRLDQVQLDPVVLAIALACAVAVGPLFGLIPALAAARADPADALREGVRGTSGAQRRLRRALVVGEVAMAVVLLAEGGLLIRSVRNIWSIDPGFDAHSVLVAQIDINRIDYPEPPQRSQFFQQVLERVRALPGVEDAGFVTDFFIHRFPDQRIAVEGEPRPEPSDPQPRLSTDWVLPGFFDAIGVPLLAGRDVTLAEADTAAPSVAVINEAMADAFWPGESPIGKRYTPARAVQPRWTTVVGVVPNLRRSDLEETPFPHAFIVRNISRFESMDLAVRATRDPLTMVEPVRRAVQEIAPNVPLSKIANAWERLDDTVAARRMQTWLLGLFSGLATLIAAIGLYALLQDFVVARRREIGIRLALGANPSRVRRLVLQEGVKLAATGLAIGVLGALAASRVTASMLFDVQPSDPVTLSAVGVTLLAIAALASWIPARYATHVPPVETLASE